MKPQNLSRTIPPSGWIRASVPNLSRCGLMNITLTCLRKRAVKYSIKYPQLLNGVVEIIRGSGFGNV